MLGDVRIFSSSPHTTVEAEPADTTEPATGLQALQTLQRRVHAELGGPKSEEEATEAVRHMQRKAGISSRSGTRARHRCPQLKRGQVYPPRISKPGKYSTKFPLRYAKWESGPINLQL